MKTIKALSLAPAVRNWLENPQHPRILHVFEQACNLIDERGEILSIVIPQIGDGPFNLVVENNIWFSKHLNVEFPIHRAGPAVSHRRARGTNGVEAPIFHTQLHLGDLTIDTMKAKLWNPRPNWEKLHARRDQILDQLLSLSLPDHQLSIPNKLASNLASALTGADISSAKTIASQLSGLGIGLTPTGDDFIMGAVYAVWIIHPIKIANVLAREVADTAAPLTTSLSAAWLRSAGNGEAGILWHQFFDALVTGEEVEFHIAKILAIGETSGADALSGFFGVCSAFKNV